VSALYFELIVIRYVTTEISLFGTLKNLVLVACFAGLGIGMIYAQKLSIRKLFGPLALVLFGFCRIASDLPLPSMNWEYQFSFGAYSRLTALLAYLGLSLGILWVIIGFTSVLGSFVGIHINRDQFFRRSAVPLASDRPPDSRPASLEAGLADCCICNRYPGSSNRTEGHILVALPSH
jgi:hypothetical protein